MMTHVDWRGYKLLYLCSEERKALMNAVRSLSDLLYQQRVVTCDLINSDFLELTFLAGLLLTPMVLAIPTISQIWKQWFFHDKHVGSMLWELSKLVAKCKDLKIAHVSWGHITPVHNLHVTETDLLLWLLLDWCQMSRMVRVLVRVLFQSR